MIAPATRRPGKPAVFSRTVGFLTLGFAAYLAFGLVRWVLLCTAHRYFQQGLWNLAFLELVRVLNACALAFAAGAAGFLVADALARIALWFLQAEGVDRRRWTALWGSLGIVIFLTGLAGLYCYEASGDSAPITPPPLSSLPRALLTLFSRFGLPEGFLFFVMLYGAIAAFILGAGTFLLGRRRRLPLPGGQSRTRVGAPWLQAAGVILLVGLGALNAWTWLGARRASSAGPNVVLISVDTLRTDHLETYGGPRKTAPNIGRLAETGINFLNAYAPAPWTLPSMASVFTGLYSYQHAAMHWDTRVRDGVTTLAEALKNNFYLTVGVISIPWLSRAHGFDQGFDVFDQSEPGGNPNGVSSGALTDKAIRYLRLRGRKKFFLWVHYLDPHYSYVRHPEYGYADRYDGLLSPILVYEHLNSIKDRLSGNDLRYILDVYDEEISFTDAAIGRLLLALRDLGLADRTLIVVLADHGEEFLERDKIGHGKTLYQELIHVPLVIAGAGRPGSERRDINEAVEVRSLGRTILDLCGARQAAFPGRDLLSPAEPVQGPTQGLVFSEGSYAEGDDGRRHAVISFPWKLIHNLDDDSYELYNLQEDQQEKRNLFAGGKAEPLPVGAFLAKEIRAFGSRGRSPESRTTLKEEDLNKLRSLGYIK